ncbi:MAG: glycosyl hydrolase [Planctomycetota bacterium]
MTVPSELEALWADRPAEYRSAPFWSWNAEMDPDRCVRAVESMHRAGMGGFFMHSRYGLKTPYLSEAWFRCVRACVDKADELGMKAYLYDEDRWPSGPAGGIVTRDRPDLAQRVLLCGPSEKVDSAGEPLARFAAAPDERGALRGYRRLGQGERPRPGEQELAFAVRFADPRGQHNDASYIDTMNPEAVAAFIDVTHEAYARCCGEAFGGVVPAIFTDEPHYGRTAVCDDDLRCASWTAALPAALGERFDYDLLDHLPELVFPLAGEAFSTVRHDYRRTCTELFAGAFSRQVGRWCADRGIAMTGHYLAEETLASQTDKIGSAMAHYEHMQWPGIDILRDQCKELATAKQCTSVADQLARRRVLSELYGCTGWDWPLEGHKYVGDWQFASGVNFRCPHLTHYSLGGGAKRDYPASIFAHGPWWGCYGRVEDYFARLGAALTQGTPLRDVLVLDTVESAWGAHVPGGAEVLQRLEDARGDIIYALSGAHRDWDFAAEAMLARHAAIDGDRLRVGRMRYELVIVPPCLTLRRSTIDLLSGFIDAGGQVLFAGEPPTRADGRPDGAAAVLAGRAARCDASGDAVVAEVDRRIARRVSVTEDGAELTRTWAMLRRVGEGRMLFVQSHDREAPHTAQVRVEGSAPVVLWDLRTGERRELPAAEADGQVSFELDLPPTGSALLSVGLEVPDAAPPRPTPKVADRRELTGPFEIELVEPNTLPLDFCRWRTAEGAWSEPVPVLQADERIRASFDLPPRSNQGPQPWYLYAERRIDTAVRARCELRWSVHAAVVPSSCKLALESPGDYEIVVNGRTPPAPGGWWVDEDIATVDVSALLGEGDNEIVLRFDYRPDMELENMYLVGAFGVARRDADRPWEPGNTTLVAPPRQLEVGSWTEQRLPFYGGAVRYRATLRKPERSRVRVRLCGVACTAAVVRVGSDEFVLPWAPFAADVTDVLCDGDNEVQIEVIGGRKNILGPLHTPWRGWTGPDQFHFAHPDWTRAYHLTEHGLTAPVVIEHLA